jgi:cold shock CspA family protein
MNDLGRFRGLVFEYDVKKGFGFITITHEIIGNGFDAVKTQMGQVFVYHKAIEPSKDGFKKLVVDQAVEFTVFKREQGLAVKDLTILGDGDSIEDFKPLTRFGNKAVEDKTETTSDNNFNKESCNKSGNIYGQK